MNTVNLRIDPTSLTVLDRNEERRIEGRGDEPYLGLLYFSSVYGKAGSTRVVIGDRLQTLGSNVRAGRRVTVPDSAGLDVSERCSLFDSRTSPELKIMSYQLVAMEQDKRGKRQVRDKLNENGRTIRAALERHFESGNPNFGFFGALAAMGEVRRELERGGLAGGSSFNEFIKWIGRADDFIGSNGVTVLNLGADTWNALQYFVPAENRIDSNFNPIVPLSNGTYTLRFRGEGAEYSVAVRLRT